MKHTVVRGFTLIESLLVLAIVASLTALLFSALGPARESGRRSGCLSNLHQWGSAFAMYIADWDGQEPVQGQSMTHAQLGLPAGQQALSFEKTYRLMNNPVAYCLSMHYSTPQMIKAHRATSYWVPGFFAEDVQPGLDDIIAARGPAFPLLVCDMHNTDTDFTRQPSWALKNIQTLHLNQQVTYKTVPVHTGDYEE